MIQNSIYCRPHYDEVNLHTLEEKKKTVPNLNQKKEKKKKKEQETIDVEISTKVHSLENKIEKNETVYSSKDEIKEIEFKKEDLSEQKTIEQIVEPFLNELNELISEHENTEQESKIVENEIASESVHMSDSIEFKNENIEEQNSNNPGEENKISEDSIKFKNESVEKEIKETSQTSEESKMIESNYKEEIESINVNQENEKKSLRVPIIEVTDSTEFNNEFIEKVDNKEISQTLEELNGIESKSNQEIESEIMEHTNPLRISITIGEVNDETPIVNDESAPQDTKLLQPKILKRIRSAGIIRVETSNNGENSDDETYDDDFFRISHEATFETDFNEEEMEMMEDEEFNEFFPNNDSIEELKDIQQEMESEQKLEDQTKEAEKIDQEEENKTQEKEISDPVQLKQDSKIQIDQEFGDVKAEIDFDEEDIAKLSDDENVGSIVEGTKMLKDLINTTMKRSRGKGVLFNNKSDLLKGDHSELNRNSISNHVLSIELIM
jgi:hypothetical protein